jgi:hypothetical protein
MVSAKKYFLTVQIATKQIYPQGRQTTLSVSLKQVVIAFTATISR